MTMYISTRGFLIHVLIGCFLLLAVQGSAVLCGDKQSYNLLTEQDKLYDLLPAPIARIMATTASLACGSSLTSPFSTLSQNEAIGPCSLDIFRQVCHVIGRVACVRSVCSSLITLYQFIILAKSLIHVGEEMQGGMIRKGIDSTSRRANTGKDESTRKELE